MQCNTGESIAGVHVVRKPMKRTIVIDDDPTGIQTVYGCLVLTAWDIKTLSGALGDRVPYFFIFSNTRSMTAEDAELVTAEIARNIYSAVYGQIESINIICRSDSTLRGHFPLELTTVEKTLGIQPDVRFFIPAFFEGNRVTVNSIHCIREESVGGADTSVTLTPCDQTEFAKDSVFGYATSYLPEYIRSRIKDDTTTVASAHLKDLRATAHARLWRQIWNLPRGSYCVIDAERYEDLECLCEVISEMQSRGKRFLFQSAASFVGSFTQTPVKPPIEGFIVKGPGVILVGSHVEKTTRQIEYLMKTCELLSVEVDVSRILSDFEDYLLLVIDKIADGFGKNRSTVVYTSRNELAFGSGTDRLGAGQIISKFLVQITKHLPRGLGFLISKGGITSHDTLARGLALKKIRVLGQAEPGVPVLMTPRSHAFGSIPFVIFPGNVGREDSLARVFMKMHVQ